MAKIYQQLSIEERTMIQTQLEMGVKAAEIARGIETRVLSMNRLTAKLSFQQPVKPRRLRRWKNTA